MGATLWLDLPWIEDLLPSENSFPFLPLSLGLNPSPVLRTCALTWGTCLKGKEGFVCLDKYCFGSAFLLSLATPQLFGIYDFHLHLLLLP